MSNLSIITKGRNFEAMAAEVFARTQDQLDLAAQRAAIKAQGLSHKITGASAASIYIVTPSSNGYRASTIRGRSKVKEWNAANAGKDKQRYTKRMTKTMGVRYHKSGTTKIRKRRFRTVGSAGPCPKGMALVTASGRFAHFQEFGQSRGRAAHPFIGPAAEAEANNFVNSLARLIR